MQRTSFSLDVRPEFRVQPAKLIARLEQLSGKVARPSHHVLDPSADVVTTGYIASPDTVVCTIQCAQQLVELGAGFGTGSADFVCDRSPEGLLCFDAANQHALCGPAAARHATFILKR